MTYEDSGECCCCCFSPDGKHLAVGSELLLVFDVASGEVITALADAAMDVVTCCAYSADGRSLATGGWDGTLRLWNTADWSCAAELQEGVQIRGCAFYASEGGGPAVVATGAADGAVRIWRGYQCTNGPLAGHTGPVNAVAFFPPRCTRAHLGPAPLPIVAAAPDAAQKT